MASYGKIFPMRHCNGKVFPHGKLFPHGFPRGEDFSRMGHSHGGSHPHRYANRHGKALPMGQAHGEVLPHGTTSWGGSSPLDNLMGRFFPMGVSPMGKYYPMKGSHGKHVPMILSHRAPMGHSHGKAISHGKIFMGCPFPWVISNISWESNFLRENVMGI